MKIPKSILEWSTGVVLSPVFLLITTAGILGLDMKIKLHALL